MTHDAVVVGAGPNGLAAAIQLARNGVSTLLLEANETVGGAVRTEEVTLPGFQHDVGSSIYPLAAASPFFSGLPLNELGLEWVRSPFPLAHPLDSGGAAVLRHDLDETLATLGPDGPRYRHLVAPFVRKWPGFIDHALDRPGRIPSLPITMARFGAVALAPTSRLISRFVTEEGRALFAGNAAHAGVPLERRLAGAVGVTLMAAAHTVGWPFPRGGAQALSGALATHFTDLGGTIETGRRVESLRDLPHAKCVVLALTHRQVAEVGGTLLSSRDRQRLGAWRYGPGAFKVDWALDEPIPWTNPDVARAATVHLGGDAGEIIDAERAAWSGGVSEKPFVLLAQHSLFDDSRAPAGKHTAWAYTHVPNGWSGGRESRERVLRDIERQVERFAPGFRDVILATSVKTPAQMEAWDANLVGGDVNGGALTVAQLLSPRALGPSAWRAKNKGVYVGSASRPPGGGVHGMSGYHAACSALHDIFGVR